MTYNLWETSNQIDTLTCRLHSHAIISICRVDIVQEHIGDNEVMMLYRPHKPSRLFNLMMATY